MPRVALITDAQTPLGEQLVRRYLAAGHCVAATRSAQERLEAPLASEEDRLLLIDWNRTSPISARNVVLAVLNRFEALDEALLVQAPQLPPAGLQELPYETIERAVDVWVKGSLFLAKGILEVFAQRRQGSLAFVQQAEPGAGPLAEALRASLRGAARKMRASCFESGDPDDEGGFAEFIVRTMRARGGRSGGRSSGRSGGRRWSNRRFRYPGLRRRLRRLVRRAG